MNLTIALLHAQTCKKPSRESQPNMINESCAYKLDSYALTYMNRLMRLSWIRSRLFKYSGARISIPMKY